MTGAEVVARARRVLGPVGVFLPHSPTAAVPVDAQRDAVGRFEAAGYRSVWVNEVIGKDALVQAAVLLAATDRLVVATGIATVWARAPQTVHGAAALLAEAYPGRVVLGVGVGHPAQAASVGADYGRPLAVMRRYLEAMIPPLPASSPAPDVAYPRIVGANGPHMLALAAELTDGAMPALVSVDATAAARKTLGPNKLLVGLLATSPTRADPAAVAAAVDEHLAAGADHVVVTVGMGGDFAAGVDHLERLAPAFADRT